MIVGVRVGVFVSVLVTVGVRVGVLVIVGVRVTVGVIVGVRVGVWVSVIVAVGVRVGVLVTVGVRVGVFVTVGVRVAVFVNVRVLVGLMVFVDVRVGVIVGVDVRVCVAVFVGVAVGKVRGTKSAADPNSMNDSPASMTLRRFDGAELRFRTMLTVLSTASWELIGTSPFVRPPFGPSRPLPLNDVACAPRADTHETGLAVGKVLLSLQYPHHDVTSGPLRLIPVLPEAIDTEPPMMSTPAGS